mgnify:CR=1 FL=1
MKEQLEKIKQEALAALAVTKESVDLEALRVKYLGKKGELTAVLKQMGKLSVEERPVIGQLANEVRERLTAEIDAQKKKIEEIKLEARLEAEAVDVTIPGQRTKLGHQHPMYIALDEIKDIFIGMGFEIDDGPEVEESIYNFDRLNTDAVGSGEVYNEYWSVSENCDASLGVSFLPDGRLFVDIVCQTPRT